jgi:hypothetical protein
MARGFGVPGRAPLEWSLLSVRILFRDGQGSVRFEGREKAGRVREYDNHGQTERASNCLAKVQKYHDLPDVSA